MALLDRMLSKPVCKPFLPTRFSILSLGLLLGVAYFALAIPLQTKTIERIDIRGYRRYPEGMIRSKIKSKPGDVCQTDRLALDVQSLYQTGLFENVEVRQKEGDTGRVVTFLVKEKPVIRSIEFVGFGSLRISAIEAYFEEHKIDFKVESLYDRAKLNAAEQALEQLLAQQGRRRDGKIHTEVHQIPPSSIRVRFILGEIPKSGRKPVVGPGH